MTRITRTGKEMESGLGLLHTEQHAADEDSSSDTTDDDVDDEVSQFYGDRADEELVDRNYVTDNSIRESPRNRRRFFLAAAAPIVSIIGVTLMLWLGKPLIDGRWPSNRILPARENSRSRRWWSFF